jgi:predicted deacylase
MKLQKLSHPLQQLPTGEVLLIHSYTFTGSTPGATIYLQANLHGPEIFGTSLLGKLINYLEKLEDIPGKIIIVPCANPIGVQAVAYQSLIGRWNLRNGNNWNRIFPADLVFKSFEEQKHYYQNLLTSSNLSIEQKLASTLKLLSWDANYIIDIHTTGFENAPHIFTCAESSEIFSDLAKIHLIFTKEDAMGAFDESHIFPFLETLPKEAIPQTCTWEVYHHNQIDETILEERFNKLISCLNTIWHNENHSKQPQPLVLPAKNSTHLVAQEAGYYSWQKAVGSLIKKGEIYATVYQPWHNQYINVKAEQDFILLGKYEAGAIPSGEEIAWIVYLQPIFNQRNSRSRKINLSRFLTLTLTN